MAHFARLDKNNTVIFVTVGRDEDNGKENQLTARTGDVYKQTSYNTRGGVHLNGGTPLRGNYAGIGYTYDVTLDAFLAPKPYASWVLNKTTFSWNAPIPQPNDNKRYEWNEEKKQWIVYIIPPNQYTLVNSSDLNHFQGRNAVRRDVTA